MTLELFIQIYLTAIFGYVTLNTFFRYHLAIDRFLLMAIALSVLCSIIYLRSDKLVEYIITHALIVLLYAALKLWSIKTQKHGYYLFNIYRSHYEDVNLDLIKRAKKNDIDEANIKHHEHSAFYVSFNHVPMKKANQLVKEMDKAYSKQKKTLSMYHYWFIVAYLILMVALWRF